MSQAIECKMCKKAGKKVIINIYAYEYNKDYHRAFIDTTGVKHIHNGLCVMGIFICSNGHTWTDRRYSSCTCGWSSNELLPQPTEEELIKLWSKERKKKK